VRAPVGVCGNAAIDVIDGGRPTVGGGPYHCGRALRLLERPSRIVAKCAPEDRAIIVPPLTALGVPLTMLDARATASFALSYEGEKRRTEILAVGDAWEPRDGDALDGLQWLHVAPLARTDFPAETLATLARGRRVSYDGQGLVRSPAAGPVRLDSEFDLAVLKHLTVLKLAQEEAATILPDDSEESVFALGVPEVVITLGSNGSIVFADGRSTHVPCHPILGVDLTGCGDAYAVGYLAARSDGLAPVAAARRATALVALLLSTRKRARSATP
jgi:sugar/nucleoside kinase (ribokinase family)